MDQQTIQQLITACTAIVAALVGAGLTAFTNYKNARKQILAAKTQHDQQWVETRAVERERWTRDKKIESYSAFLRAGSPFTTLTIGRITKAFSVVDRDLGAADLHAALTDVVIFGSSDVIDAASQYRGLAGDLAGGLSKIRKKIEGDAHQSRIENLDVAKGETVASIEELTDKAVRDEAMEFMQARMPVLYERFTQLVNLMRKDCGIEEIDGVFSVRTDNLDG